MKQLSTKKIFSYILYNGLKTTPPKDYPSMEEMMSTVDEILPALEKGCLEFVEFRKRADEINVQLASGKLQQEEAGLKLAELQKEVRIFEAEKGEVIVVVDLESAAFAVVGQQFERWGKQWFNKLEDFVAFKKDLSKTA